MKSKVRVLWPIITTHIQVGALVDLILEAVLLGQAVVVHLSIQNVLVVMELAVVVVVTEEAISSIPIPGMMIHAQAVVERVVVPFVMVGENCR